MSFDNAPAVRSYCYFNNYFIIDTIYDRIAFGSADVSTSIFFHFYIISLVSSSHRQNDCDMSQYDCVWVYICFDMAGVYMAWYIYILTCRRHGCAYVYSSMHTHTYTHLSIFMLFHLKNPRIKVFQICKLVNFYYSPSYRKVNAIHQLQS